MGINSQGAKRSVDFDWQDQDQDGKPIGSNWNIKYHHTEQFGETLTLTDKDGAVSLPAKMIAEAVDFLRTERLLINNISYGQPVETFVEQRVVLPGGLPIPEIITASGEVVSSENTVAPKLLKTASVSKPEEMVGEGEVPPEIFLSGSGEPLQSFSTIEITETDESVGIDDIFAETTAQNAQNTHPSPTGGAKRRDGVSNRQPSLRINLGEVPDTPPELKAKANKMLSQRMNAKKNAAGVERKKIAPVSSKDE